MKIRRRKYRNGKKGWQLDAGLVDGKRYQRAFATKEAAEAERDRLLADRRKHGDAALAMSHERRLAYAAAEERLAAAGVSLEQAVVWAIERGSAVREHKTVAELRDSFIEEKTRTNCRERTLRQYRVSLGSFVLGREAMRADEVKQEDVKRWLGSNDWAPKTQANYLGDLRGMFIWAQKNRFVSLNPTDDVTPARQRTEKEIEALAPEQVAALFKTAVTATARCYHRDSKTYSEEYVFRPLLGYVALATFCGIRPEEIMRSGADALHLDEGVFVVAGSIAKTGKRRPVDLPTSALAWLKLWRQLCGERAPIIPRNFRKLWERLRERAKLKPEGWNTLRGRKPDLSAERGDGGLAKWPHDVLRHTTATMDYALHQDAARIKAQLGHDEDEDTLHRHYRAVRVLDGRPVTKSMAQRFWSILPTPELLGVNFSELK